MTIKAQALLRAVEERVRRCPTYKRFNNQCLSQSDPASHTSPILLSPGRKIPRTADILPRDLAIALALLEGDRYKAILPADYIAHLRRDPWPNNIDAASITNNKIVLWVKKSILHYDRIESRAQVLKFFINTAQVCCFFPSK